MPVGPLDLDETQPITSTWRRRGEYIYRLDIYEVPLARVGRWYARLDSLVYLGNLGQRVTVTLPDAYGASPDDAYARLDAAIDAWAQAQTQTPER